MQLVPLHPGVLAGRGADGAAADFGASVPGAVRVRQEGVPRAVGEARGHVLTMYYLYMLLSR